MESNKLVQFLKNATPFPINEEIACTIVQKFRYRELDRGDLFLEAGKKSNEYMFLEAGCIRSFLFDTEGNEITLNLYTSNDIVLEAASFFQRIPAQENMEALTFSKGWVLSFEELNTLFHTLPEFREFGRGILVKILVEHKLRTLSMINKTAEERYEQLLRSKPEIFQHSPLKYIASYLGITDTSLSRIRKSLTKK